MDETKKYDPFKNFWGSSEGLVGIILGVAAVAGIGWLAMKILPYVLATVGLVIALGVLAGLLMLAFTDNFLRRAISLRYKQLVRAAFYTVVAYDPAASLKIMKEATQERIDKAMALLKDVRSAANTVEKTVRQFTEEARQYAEKAEYLMKKGVPDDDLQLQSARKNYAFLAGESGSIPRMTKILNNTRAYQDVLVKAGKAAQSIQDELELKIRVVTEEYTVTNVAAGVGRQFMKIFSRGDALNTTTRDMIQFVEELTAQQLGELDMCIDAAEPFIKASETNDGMKAAEGERLLQSLRIPDTKALSSNNVSTINSGTTLRVGVPRV